MKTIPEGEILVDENGNFVMSPSTLQTLTSYVEEEDIEDEAEAALRGRKDYCCHNNEDGRCKVIRASNSVSAAVKCMAHYGARPVTSHRGGCNH